MHRISKAARRYGKSLLDFAVEQKSLEAVHADMQLIAETCLENKDLRVLLKSPVVKPSKKQAIVKAIFGGKIGTITLKFIEVITSKNREDILPEIAVSFTQLYREYNGIVTAEIITAFPLGEDLRQEAIAFIKEQYDKVELTEKIDKDLIGGFIIRVGDKQFDQSISRRLLALRREFQKNPYISEL